MEDLEPFYPDRMAGRILGMGDVLSFVEKAQEVVSTILFPLLFCSIKILRIFIKWYADAPRRC